MPLFTYERASLMKGLGLPNVRGPSVMVLPSKSFEDVTACNSEPPNAQQCLAFRPVPKHEPKNQLQSECGAIYLATGQRLLNWGQFC